MSETENETQGFMGGPNIAGLLTLSENQQIAFARYVRYVLPLDGYVFWLKTNEMQVAGSLHTKADKRQNEDETIAVTRIIFSTGMEVQRFNEIGPDEIWVGTIPPPWKLSDLSKSVPLKFAFSQSGPRYEQSGVFHYMGDAVYPALQSQLVDVGEQLPTDTLIVSNSLPAWLSLVSYNPVWVSAGIPNPFITLYPSFAVPDNITPPYGTVHIMPEQTKGLGAFPVVDPATSTQWQLATDTVRVTLYGLTNLQAMNFEYLVIQYSRDTDAIGFMQEPVVVRDEKRTQPELGILAMKKTLQYQIAYNQGTVRNHALQLIEKATATIMPQLLAA